MKLPVQTAPVYFLVSIHQIPYLLGGMLEAAVGGPLGEKQTVGRMTDVAGNRLGFKGAMLLNTHFRCIFTSARTVMTVGALFEKS